MYSIDSWFPLTEDSGYPILQKQKSPDFSELPADWTGLEPATSAVTGRHSNQLNYQSIPFKKECKDKG